MRLPLASGGRYLFGMLRNQYVLLSQLSRQSVPYHRFSFRFSRERVAQNFDDESDAGQLTE